MKHQYYYSLLLTTFIMKLMFTSRGEKVNLETKFLRRRNLMAECFKEKMRTIEKIM